MCLGWGPDFLRSRVAASLIAVFVRPCARPYDYQARKHECATDKATTAVARGLQPFGSLGMAKYRVMHPWGPDKGRQATLQSEHATIAEAFAAIDAIRAQMARTGAPTDAIELIVVDEDGRQVPRPGSH